MSNRFDDAAKREGLPVEQGARDSVQHAINALERARDASALFPFLDNTITAVTEIKDALAIQRVQRLDLEGQNDILLPLLPTEQDEKWIEARKTIVKQPCLVSACSYGRGSREHDAEAHNQAEVPVPNERGLVMYADTFHVFELAEKVAKLAKSPETSIKLDFLGDPSTMTIKVVPGSEEDAKMVEGLPNPMGGWDIG